MPTAGAPPTLRNSSLAANWLRGRALAVTSRPIGSRILPAEPALASPRRPGSRPDPVRIPSGSRPDPARIPPGSRPDPGVSSGARTEERSGPTCAPPLRKTPPSDADEVSRRLHQLLPASCFHDNSSFSPQTSLHVTQPESDSHQSLRVLHLWRWEPSHAALRTRGSPPRSIDAIG